SDPGTEGEAGDPDARCIRIDRLHPVEGCCRIRKLALPAGVCPLRASDTAEVEAQGREASAREDVEQVVDDLVVHRPAVLRVRMQHQREWRIRSAAMVVPPLDPALRAVDDDFWHLTPHLNPDLWQSRQDLETAIRAGRAGIGPGSALTARIELSICRV